MNRNAGVAGGFGFAGTDANGGQLGYTWNNNNANTYGFNSGIFPADQSRGTFVALVIQPNSRCILYSFSSQRHKVRDECRGAHSADVFRQQLADWP